jgi:hypothetical protein
MAKVKKIRKQNKTKKVKKRTKERIVPKEIREYETIVEYSYNERQDAFVIRFLDGSSYCLKILDLPKKMQTKKPIWSKTILSPSRSTLFVPMEKGKEIREIPSHIIHSHGNAI